MSQDQMMAGMQASQGLTQFAGSYVEARALKSQASYQASQYEFNSDIAELQAKDAIRRGNQEAIDYKKGVKQLVGDQRAKLAAQGIEVSTGSALELQLDTAAQGAENIQTIRNNAFRESTGYKLEAIDQRAKAGMTRVAGKFGARTSLVSGGVGAANSFLKAGSTLSKSRK